MQSSANRPFSECFGNVEKRIAFGSVCWFIPFRTMHGKDCFPLEFHLLAGCGMEQHDPISWRTELCMRKAFALEEHAKAV